MTDSEKITFLSVAVKDHQNPIEALLDMEIIEQMLRVQRDELLINQFAPGVRKRKRNYREVLESLLEQRINLTPLT